LEPTTPIKNSSSGLVRQLGLFDSTMVVIGIVIGSGIFMTTGIMAMVLPSVPLILLAWLLGGLHALAGALTYAELGAAMPQAGGQYVYLKKAYGPLPAFLFGWIAFFAYLTGTIAAIAVAFAEYFGHFFPALSTKHVIFSASFHLITATVPISISSGQCVAVLVIVGLSLVNYLGLFLGKIVQNIFTVAKIGTVILFVIFGMAASSARPLDFSINPSALGLGQLLSGIGIALVAVSWTVGGWEYVTFVAGEIKNPGRNIPRALILGTVTVTALYILINVVYLKTLPLSEMAGVVTIAERSASVMYGPTGSTLLSAAVIISTFGALNGSILVGPRVYYAMAKDRLFFSSVSKVHPRYHTPGNAILLQAVWAAVLTLTGTFEQLFTFVVFVNLMLWIVAAAAVFTLRKKSPHLPRPYKTWGYPTVPLVFIIATAGIMLNSLVEKPVESLAGLAFTAIGIPIYLYWHKKDVREIT